MSHRLWCRHSSWLDWVGKRLSVKADLATYGCIVTVSAWIVFVDDVVLWKQIALRNIHSFVYCKAAFTG